MDKRIEVLDGLRGVAILLVVFQHALEFFPILQAAPTEPLGFILQNYLNFGRLGVVIFFLISGYLIPFTLKAETSGVSAFWVSRFFRLYPLYWCSLGLAIAVFYFVPVREPTSARDAILNVSVFQLALGGRNVLEPYWTLFVELVFYAICASAFFVRLNRQYQPLLFIGLFSLMILSLSLPAVLIGDLPVDAMYKASTFTSYLMIMFAGMFIRIDETDGYKRGHELLIVAAISVAMAAYTWSRLESDFNRLLSPASVLISTLSGVLIFLFRRNFARLLASRALIAFGAVSYGIYLFHPIVLHVAVKTLPHGGGGIQFTVFSLIVIAVTFAIAIAIAIASVGYRVVEQPAIEAGKRVRRRLLANKAVVRGG